MTDSERAERVTEHDERRSAERERQRKWLADAERLVTEVLGEERVEAIKAEGARAPEAGDAVLAAYLDDMRLIEQARFHRARRDVARELATGNSAAEAAAVRRMNVAADGLGILRLQRDAVLEDEEAPEPHSPEKKPHTGERRLRG